MRTTTLVACLVVATLAITPNTSHADMVSFNYSWSIDPGPVFTGSNGNTGNGLSTGSVAFALSPDGMSSAMLGDLATIPVGSITSTSSAGGDVGSDVYNSSFSISLLLEDVTSGDTDTLTFTGSLTGELTGTTSNLTASFDPTTAQATLGGRLYQFSFDTNPMLIPAPGTTPEQLMASLRITGATGSEVPTGPIDGDPTGGDPVVHETPEPSTLLLASLAAPLICQVYRRRRRAAAATV